MSSRPGGGRPPGDFPRDGPRGPPRDGPPGGPPGGPPRDFAMDSNDGGKPLFKNRGFNLQDGASALKQVTFLEALPQLLKLLTLLWQLSPTRTLVMLFGNFTKSLIPAYDLSIRAQLIEIINVTIRNKQQFQGSRIMRLLVLQLASLLFRNGLEIALNNNQLVVNTELTRILKRQLLDVHLKLDSAALAIPANQALLTDAVSMTSPGYLASLISIVFNLTNTVTDLSARVLATSQTISLDALPYFLTYSALPLTRILYSRFRDRNWQPSEDAADNLRKADLASIAFDVKSRRELSLMNLQEFVAEEYSLVDERLQRASAQQNQGYTLGGRALDIVSSFSNSATYALLAWRSQQSDISLADLHLIENTTTSLIFTGDRALQNQQASSKILNNLLSYYKALDLKPALPVPAQPELYSPTTNGMTIVFKEVSFRYDPNGPLVLDRVSFTIQAGQIAALVGFNGAGKSSIIGILGRVFDPTSGKVLINGINLKMYDLKDLYAHMSFTHQDFSRWPLTGYENVAVGDIKERKNVDRVKDAARATGAYEVLDAKNVKSKKPEESTDRSKLWNSRLSKLTSEMQQAQTESSPDWHPRRHRRPEVPAVELSGGQWQKVALARSFLRGGELLVLDEPSANLDPQAEYDLFSHLVKTRLGRTTLFITHRLGVVKSSDQIIFLDKGKVTEQGSHEELMALENGKYRHLVQIQTEGFQR